MSTKLGPELDERAPRPNATASTASTAAQLIDALLDGSEAVEEGSFTLDPAAAVAKMRAFKYADRSRYLIPIVEALHGLDATRVTITGEGVDFTVQGTAVDLPNPSRTLQELYSCAVGSPRDELGHALARLAVGVDMGLGHGSIERIVISYGTGTATYTAEYREGAAPRVVRGGPGPTGRLRVFVDRPLSSTFATDGTATRELDHLRRAIRFSPRPLSIHAKPASQQQRRLWDPRRGESEDGCRYLVGFEPEGEGPSKIELWSAGIQVDELDAPGLALRAVLHLDAPRRDLSQMKVVRSELVERALAQLELERGALLAKLAEDDARWGSQRPTQWPEARVDRVLERPVRTQSSESGATKGASPVTDTLSGIMFYAFGIGAGAAAVGAMYSRNLMGLFVLIFFFSHAGSGAGQLATTFAADDRSQRTLFFGLLGLAAILSTVIGLTTPALWF